MKKLRILTIALAAAVCGISAFAQTTQKLTATKINEYGLIYALPLTRVNVTFEATKTVRQPGEFFRYSKKYLGIDPITEPSVDYQLTGATLTSEGFADQDERYLVQFKSGSTPFMIVDQNDFPVAVNTEKSYEPLQPKLPKAVDAAPTILETPVAAQAVTAEMQQSPSSAKRAELAAARIFELRQSRSEIISGTAENMPSDGTAMQLALDNLAQQEAALTAMFVGTTQTSTEVGTYSFTPNAADNQVQTVIARLSPSSGLVDADDLSGRPITLTVKVTERGTLPKNEKGETKRFPKGGYAYRIPGTAQFSVTFDGNEVASESLPVAQLGVVFGLDPNIFTDKKAPAYAVMNPVTGAVVEIGVVK